ncbi:Caspase domain-containing protein [Ruegeria halocynthiae]|uniref:Caspase domain-containing protein n=1 Tax=Ruegeria halocynthiae TaxID=985054 RepID=A0A1H2W6V8_9RHOB|nr:Caspase domain-containing protein [Ruegeria halocynthiae]
MSQNIALLIGNTQYDSMSTLGCCKNDVEQMHELLSGTQKFSQIVDFVDQPVSSVKDRIRKLAEENDECDEIFLFFTGHGLSNSDDFFMCFQGFKETSPNTTGLSRSEAFELLRLFNSDLSVVVIDACEAGRNLIKTDTPPLARAIKSGFTNFVQIASCTEAQFSLAGEEISAFSDEFIKACLQKTNGPVYYSDVESALRDAFLNNPNQTPHFIRQGTAQEKFCDDANRLSGFRNVYLVTGDTAGIDGKELKPTKDSFAAAKSVIEGIEDQVPSKDEAQSFVDSMFEATVAMANLTPEVSEFFETRIVKYDNFDNVQNKRSVINLLNRRGGSDRFVESNVERTKRRTPFGALTIGAWSALAGPDEYDETFSLYNRCDLKSVHVGIYFEPKFMALSRLFSEVVFLPRLTECLMLTCNSIEPRTGWGTFQEYEGSKSWEWTSHKWTADKPEAAKGFGSSPIDYVREYVLSFSESSE